MGECFLESKTGKSFQVMKLREKLQLCLVDSQNSGTRVTIRKRNDTQMAFGFAYDGGCYFLKANGDALELVSCALVHSLDSDCYWFEKQNIGGSEHYGLRTVAEPQRYLATLNAARLGLSPEIILLLTIKDRSIRRPAGIRPAGVYL